VRAHVAGLQLLRNPSRLEKVFELDAFIPNRRASYEKIVEAARAFPGPAQALAERHRVHVDLAVLRELPEGTFGRAAADFLDANGLDPRSLPDLASPGEAEWAQAHLYETHDLWHVATGFATDIPGEVGLQAFYLAQLPAQLAQLLIVGGLLHAIYAAPDDYKVRLGAISRGWELGLRAKPLFGVRWDTLWDQPLERVRQDLGLDPAAPPLPRVTGASGSGASVAAA
jgi:ubiquinone biosynthesis protein Coq4